MNGAEENKLMAERRAKLANIRKNCDSNGHPNHFKPEHLTGELQKEFAELDKEALLLARIHLPLDDDDHMPPDGKLQLSSEEKMILQLWINTGAGFNTKVIEITNGEMLLN